MVGRARKERVEIRTLRSSVRAADVVLLDDEAQQPYAFTVQTPQRLWTFYCETESQRKAWKKNIIAVSNELNGVASGK